MGNSTRNRQQPYQQTPVENTTPVSQVPMTAWPDEDARTAVIRTNEEAWRRHHFAARTHRGNSDQLAAELGKLVGEFEELRRLIEAKTEQKQREDHAGDVESRTAAGYEVALTALGASVPGDQLVHPPATPQGDPTVHAAAFGGPLDPQQRGSFPETEPHGYCVYCRQPAWRCAVSDTAPFGATHSYGPTCEPENPESKVARLSEQILSEAAS